MKPIHTTAVQIAIQMLKGILSWSDRIGSDEISEINEVITILKRINYGNKKLNKSNKHI